MKIGLVSNMYPSIKDPVYGVFVKNIELQLQEQNIISVSKAVIKGRKKSFFKIIAYLKFYIDISLVFLNPKLDLVYVHFPLQSSIIILFLNRFSSKKIVLNIHGSELNKNSRFYRSFQRLLSKANLIIVPSAYYKKRLLDELNVIDSNVYVSPSGGVNSSTFYSIEKHEIRKELSFDTNWFVCSYISTIAKEKGWDVYFNSALQLLEKSLDIKFLIVGSGVDEIIFKEKVKNTNYKNSFIFTPRQNQNNLVKFFNASDLFIFPTYRKEESLGLVGLEAMACGVPVIGSKVGAIQDYISNGINGYLFEPKNAKDLAEKIELYFNSTEKDNFKKEALKTAAKFDSKYCSFVLAEKLKQL